MGDAQEGELAVPSALYDQYKLKKEEFDKKVFAVCNIDVHRLRDPPAALKAKPFDNAHVLEMVSRWIPDRCATAHAVLWDLPDAALADRFGSLFDFGVTAQQAEELKKLSDVRFQEMCLNNDDSTMAGMKLFVTSGRHTSRALEILVDTSEFQM